MLFTGGYATLRRQTHAAESTGGGIWGFITLLYFQLWLSLRVRGWDVDSQLLDTAVFVATPPGCDGPLSLQSRKPKHTFPLSCLWSRYFITATEKATGTSPPLYSDLTTIITFPFSPSLIINCIYLVPHTNNLPTILPELLTISFLLYKGIELQKGKLL